MTPMSGSAAALLAHVVASFEVGAPALDALARAFSAEIGRGLAGESGSLKMLRTFTRQPTGAERGRVVVVDWGGTNARAGLVELGGGAARIVTEEKLAFPEALKRGAPEPVFDLIAGTVARVAQAQGVSAAPLAFVYSYPARLERIDRAVALASTKGWRLEGLVGRDVAALLTEALGRARLPGIRVAAIANDTVAVLILESYRRVSSRQGDGRPDTGRPATARTGESGLADIGLILGTGTNQAADLGPAGIRNLESGNFDGVGGVETPYDATLDRELEEPRPGAQRFEKMVSGHYLGEIVRRALVDLGQRTDAFQWEAAPVIATAFALDSAYLSRIAADGSPELTDVDALLRSLYIAATREERRGLRALTEAVARRAARLVAASLLGTLRHLDPELARPRRVAVDGSLWEGYPGFAAMVRDTFGELVGPARAARIETTFVQDSTSAGAAVIAAAAAGQRSEGCSSA
jgi:hexokinase